MGQVGRTFLGYPSPASHGGAIFGVPSSFQSGKDIWNHASTSALAYTNSKRTQNYWKWIHQRQQPKKSHYQLSSTTT
jgi:hypothetical protein